MVETKDFFDRTDLHQLVSFLLYGVENNDNKCNAYESRISATSTELLKKIQSLNIDKGVYEEITDDIVKAFSVYEEVYTSIGLKMGVKLFLQLAFEDDKFRSH